VPVFRPPGFASQQQSDQTTDTSSAYFSQERFGDLLKATAMCFVSSAPLFEADFAALSVPPLAAVGLTVSVLGLGSCVALGTATLMPMSDQQLQDMWRSSAYLGPGLFVSPLGAAWGQSGVEFIQALGNFAFDIVGLSTSSSVGEALANRYFLGVDYGDLVDKWKLINLDSKPKEDPDSGDQNADPNSSPPPDVPDLSSVTPPGPSSLGQSSDAGADPDPSSAFGSDASSEEGSSTSDAAGGGYHSYLGLI